MYSMKKVCLLIFLIAYYVTSHKDSTLLLLVCVPITWNKMWHVIIFATLSWMELDLMDLEVNWVN